VYEKRIEEKATRREYWLNPSFNKSGKLGSFVVTRELD
jgi:hypothetical protein